MYIIAYDLGTGGVKASLYDGEMRTVAKSFMEYTTYYPAPDMHEQCPEDWWNGVAKSTRALLRGSGVQAEEVGCVSLSGASLVAIPMDMCGNALLERVPIWSDTRAAGEAAAFFETIPEKEWYLATGNGFPAPCYSIFKLMWMRKNQPEIFRKTAYVLGSKDYINYLLTGAAATDFSYASGTGAYDLKERRMKPAFLEAAGLPQTLFLPPVPSHTVIGEVTQKAAGQTGLAAGTKVVCGGVDNACMALGAVGAGEGRVYVSLGSSSWIPVNSREPVLDEKKKPYVFAHIEEGMFTSAFSIFAGGSSLRWVRETLCRDLQGEDAYQKMDALAQTSPVGAGGVFFNPSLAGGTSQDKSLHIRGAFVGLHLGTTREDMIRAAMEGIAFNLRMSLDYLRKKTKIEEPLLFCGGGSKSAVWTQMFADIFQMEIHKTNIDQDAASLGAAAIAARGLGWWRDYAPIDSLHHLERKCVPNAQDARQYEKLLPVFRHICDVAADLGDYMKATLHNDK